MTKENKVYRQNGFYWVQQTIGVWEVLQYRDGFWIVTDDFSLLDCALEAIHEHRIEEPNYQP